ncbi:LysR family transcriptional regulator [Knoellia sp. CPCC 206453]|uniref:LysR family transcriptional regulator n=1 Tax=Knoellia pratensis TaxID=3404796 RepID=UPI00360C7AFA
MDVEIRHLRVLVAVAEHGSISKAAAALGQSQPALSSQLGRIERSLGAQLFERTRTGVVSTSHGRSVLARAQLVLAEMAELRGLDIDSHASPGAVELRLGGMPGPLLPAVIHRLTRREGGELTLRAQAETSMSTLLRRVQDGQLDAALIADFDGYPTPTPAGVRREVLVPIEPVFIGLSEHHPLAARDVVELRELADEQWLIDPTDDFGGSPPLRRACRDAGFEPHIAHEVSDSATARAFVRSGHYVGLFMAMAPEDSGVVVRPLAGDPIVQRYDLAWSERCPVDPAEIRRAASDAYLSFVDRNASFYRWWTEHHQS